MGEFIFILCGLFLLAMDIELFVNSSIFGRAIAIGFFLGVLFSLLDWGFWVGALLGVIIGFILPFILDIFDYDYTDLCKKKKCPRCGSTDFKYTTEGPGGDMDDIFIVCKKCGYTTDEGGREC